MDQLAMSHGSIERRLFLAGLSAAALPLQNLKAEVSSVSLLQACIDNYVATKRLAGAAALVTRHDEVTLTTKAGELAFDSRLPFDEHSLCRVYSMTKPVTGLAAMLLIERGQLSLDEPIGALLPELGDPRVAIDPGRSLESRPAARPITVRHLLTHSSGLAYWTPEAGTDALSSAFRARGITPGNYYASGLARPGYGPQAKGLDDMMTRLAELPLAADPGTAWRYSIGLDVMGLLIERLSKRPFATFVQQEILDPLKMHSSGFGVARSAAARLSTNYSVTPAGLVPLDPGESSVFLRAPNIAAGGAGLISTAHDFSRFGAMLLNGGTLDGVRVLREETVALACSNLLPAQVTYRGGGFGAGMRVAAGGPTVRDAPGAMSWNGAAGTMWIVDPVRRLNVVFMSQFMPPTSYPIWDEVPAALLQMGLGGRGT